jgi:hypothetical protein
MGQAVAGGGPLGCAPHPLTPRYPTSSQTGDGGDPVRWEDSFTGPIPVDAVGGDADGKLRWASASDPLAQSLEDHQEVFAAGPYVQAFASGRPAVIHDATLEPRWGEITEERRPRHLRCW